MMAQLCTCCSCKHVDSSLGLSFSICTSKKLFCFLAMTLQDLRPPQGGRLEDRTLAVHQKPTFSAA